MNNVIGFGVTGIMYKATLPNGCFLAVKKLYDSQLSLKRFELEIMILGQYNHRNIVPLIGFCIEEGKSEFFLVYQYMPNGKLSDRLNEITTKLGWKMVIKIALGVARGLCCLHHSLHMVHLNINSDCILLGKNFEPKISNFGGAMFMNNDLNKDIGLDKKDVFDFGCLVFEMINGKKFGQICEYLSNTNVPLCEYNHVNMLEDDPSRFCDAVDEYLNKIEFEDEVYTLVKVARECVQPLSEKRPSMFEVYNKICNIWEKDRICENPNFSFIDSVTPTVSLISSQPDMLQSY
jgi:serine/threonine protein kinase